MTTREFLDRLAPHAELLLTWWADGAAVPAGYHVTEIKSAAVRAMDCGGRAARWHETVLQVLPPVAPSGEAPMKVAKFLSIFGRVAAGVPIEEDAHVRVEHGALGRPAVGYLIEEIGVGPHGVEVRLAPPVVACKGADPTLEDIPVLRERAAEHAIAGSSACCGSGLPVAAGGACCG